MSESTNYYKIGVFVIVGVTLFVIALILLSSVALFNPPDYFESYFDKSVEGLTVGSAVKYRGVQVGTVEDISFVGVIYKSTTLSDVSDDRFSQYIYVRMALRLPFIQKLSKERIKKDLNLAVKEGLRVRLMPQGLTGNSYLELDYFSPKTNIPLTINWQPNDFYIPSAPSTYTQLVELFEELHKADLPKIFRNINITFDSVNHILKKGQYDKLGIKFQTTLNLLNQTLNHTNLILGNQQHGIQSSVANVQGITQNVRDLSETTSQYPSQLILGSPPPRVKKR